MKLPFAVDGVVMRVARLPPEDTEALVTLPTSGATWARPSPPISGKQIAATNNTMQIFPFTNMLLRFVSFPVKHPVLNLADIVLKNNIKFSTINGKRRKCG
jgi:hypothetical protein